MVSFMLNIQKTQNNTRSSAYLELDKSKIREHRLKRCAVCLCVVKSCKPFICHNSVMKNKVLHYFYSIF